MSVERIIVEVQRQARSVERDFMLALRLTASTTVEHTFHLIRVHSGFLELYDEEHRQVFIPNEAIAWVRPEWL